MAEMNPAVRQMTPDTAKANCRSFLAALLRDTRNEPDDVAWNVRELVQVITVTLHP